MGRPVNTLSLLSPLEKLTSADLGGCSLLQHGLQGYFLCRECCHRRLAFREIAGTRSGNGWLAAIERLSQPGQAPPRSDRVGHRGNGSRGLTA